MKSHFYLRSYLEEVNKSVLSAKSQVKGGRSLTRLLCQKTNKGDVLFFSVPVRSCGQRMGASPMRPVDCK